VIQYVCDDCGRKIKDTRRRVIESRPDSQIALNILIVTGTPDTVLPAAHLCLECLYKRLSIHRGIVE